VRSSRRATLGAVLLTAASAMVALGDVPAVGALEQRGTAQATPRRHLVDGQTVTVSWSGLPQEPSGNIWECPGAFPGLVELQRRCTSLHPATGGSASGSATVAVREGPLGEQQVPCPPAGSSACAIVVINYDFSNPSCSQFPGDCPIFYTAPATISFSDRELVLKPPSGPPGTSMTTKGYSFTPGEPVKVFYKTGLASPQTILLCSATAGANGFFACTGSIPSGANAGPAGAHKIAATAPSGKASGTFTRT
jgi:hypothetical protein